MAAKIILRLA